MKKILWLLLIAVFISAASSGQPIKKGNLIGLHIVTVSLQPGVTISQYKDFIIHTGIPDFEKNFPGVKGFLMEAIRGENENSIGLIYFFESESVRDKYFKDGGIDGVFTELGKAANDAHSKTVGEKYNSIVKSLNSRHTDWLIQ